MLLGIFLHIAEVVLDLFAPRITIFFSMVGTVSLHTYVQQLLLFSINVKRLRT